jgi:hypothetical protein
MGATILSLCSHFLYGEQEMLQSMSPCLYFIPLYKNISLVKLPPCETPCYETPWNAFQHLWISRTCDFFVENGKLWEPPHLSSGNSICSVPSIWWLTWKPFYAAQTSTSCQLSLCHRKRRCHLTRGSCNPVLTSQVFFFQSPLPRPPGRRDSVSIHNSNKAFSLAFPHTMC